MSETHEATGSVADDTSRDDQQAANQSAEDTSAETGAEAPENDDETGADAEGGEGEAEPSEEDKARAQLEADTVEVEDENGVKHRVPKALEKGYLRDRDYRQKTQALADDRRAVEAERATFESQKAESLAELPEEHAKVALVNHQIASVNARLDTPVDASGITLRNIDWPAYRAAANAAGGEDLELYQDRRAAYEAARADLSDLTEAQKAAKETLSAKETERLSGQRAKAEEAAAKAWEETGRILADEKTGIKGWNETKATELASLAVNQYGVTPEELKGMHDPRLWRILNDNAAKTAALAKAEAQLKKHNIASENERAQQSTPATKPGSAGVSVRKTTDASGDGLSTTEWMRRENERVAKQRRG